MLFFVEPGVFLVLPVAPPLPPFLGDTLALEEGDLTTACLPRVSDILDTRFAVEPFEGAALLVGVTLVDLGEDGRPVAVDLCFEEDRFPAEEDDDNSPEVVTDAIAAATGRWGAGEKYNFAFVGVVGVVVAAPAVSSFSARFCLIC